MVRVKINNVAVGSVRGLFHEIDGKSQATAIAGTAEAFSHLGGRFVSLRAETTNPLVAAVHFAFAHHLPLELSPDVVFNTILQGVSAHVATDPARFRSVFVAHQGKKTLVARDDALVRGDWGGKWDVLIRSLGAQVFKSTSGRHARNVLGTAFTTTTLAEATAHTTVFMDAVKHFYEYTVMTCCGIPWVDVTGTREDWARMGRVIEPLLLELGLAAWNKELQLILKHFCRAFDGGATVAADHDHWDRMYNYFGPKGSGGVATVSGWIAKLFLHVRSGVNPILQSSGSSAVKLCDFPAGITTTPFTWQYLGTDIPMSLIAGLVGVTVAQSGALRPEVGWIVARAGQVQPPQGIRRFDTGAATDDEKDVVAQRVNTFGMELQKRMAVLYSAITSRFA